MNYMQLSNIDAKKWTKTETKRLLDLCCNDDRVESIASISELDENGKLQFKVKMDLGRGETVNEILSVGKLAGLLHQSRHNHAANKNKNAQSEDKFNKLDKVKMQSDIIYVNQKLLQYKTSISAVLYVIDRLERGLIVKNNLESQNAFDLVEWNQAHGTGDWFIFINTASKI